MLNKDLLQCVGEYLSSADLGNLLVLSKHLHRVFSCENYWKRKVMHEYPEEAAVAETMTYRKLYRMMDGMPPQLKKIFAHSYSHYQNLSAVVQKISSCAIQEQIVDEDEEYKLDVCSLLFVKRELPLRLIRTSCVIRDISRNNYFIDQKAGLSFRATIYYQLIPEEKKALYKITLPNNPHMNIAQFSKWKDAVLINYRPIGYRHYDELIEKYPQYFSVRITDRAPQRQ